MPITTNPPAEGKTYRPAPPYRKTVIRFFALSLVFGLASFLYPIFLPFAAAFFAALFLFENPKKRRLSYVTVGVLGIAEALLALFGFGFSCLTPLAVVPALVLAFAFHAGWNRRDTAVCTVLLLTFLLLLSLYFEGAGNGGSYAPKAVYDYYIGVYEEAETVFVQSMLDVLRDSPMLSKEYSSLITEEDVVTFASSLKSYLFTMIAWVAMAFACVSTRTFARLARKVTGIEMHPFFTDFLLTSLTAYLFFALSCVSAHTSNTQTASALVIQNLVLLLTLPFAYIGVKGLIGIFSRSNRTGMKVLTVAALVIFNVYALRLLAYFGAFANIMFNRAIRDSFDRTE